MDPAQETIDYVAVSRLHSAYADIATRRAWNELDDIFVPEIPITIDLRDRDAYVFDNRDAFREFDGRWWYVSRNYSSLARPAHDVDSFPFPAPDPFAS